MSDTPETDSMTWSGHCGDGDWGRVVYAHWAQKIERERNEWKAKYIQQNKDLGCELRDPNGTIWDYAALLKRERDEARIEADSARKVARSCGVVHPDHKFPWEINQRGNA